MPRTDWVIGLASVGRQDYWEFEHYDNINESVSIDKNTFENVIWKMAAIVLRSQCFTPLLLS